jgi:DNA-binding transcriptional MerR regulator
MSLPDKQFFKIGEAASLVGVKAHVLRYWEAEIRALRPLKTRGAHRMYRREDVETFRLVRKLLQEDGLTLAAVKKRLLGGAAAAGVGTVAQADGLTFTGPAPALPEAEPSRQLSLEVDMPEVAAADVAEAALHADELTDEHAADAGPAEDGASEAIAAAVERFTGRSDAARALELRAELLRLRSDLAALLAQLDAPPPPAADTRVATATVTAVVPMTVLMHRAVDFQRAK